MTKKKSSSSADWQKTAKELQQEEEEQIFSNLDSIPDEYFEDPEYRKKQKHLEWLREEREKKREELEKFRTKVTRHYEELSRLRRVIGQLYGILSMMLSDSENCREIAQQLKAASSVLRKMSAYVLKKHGSRCLTKDKFKGTEAERYKEAELTLRLLSKLFAEFEVVGISQWEVQQFEQELLSLEKEVKKLPEKTEKE